MKNIIHSTCRNGLVLTFLVFGAMNRPTLALDHPNPLTYQRASFLCKKSEKLSRHVTDRQAQDEQGHLSRTDVTDIYKWPMWAPVLIYRPKIDRWNRLYSFMHLDGEGTIVVLHAHEKYCCAIYLRASLLLCVAWKTRNVNSDICGQLVMSASQ